jgi:predicted dehydrogenase
MAGRKLRGVCIGAGYFSHFQYEAWQRIPEVEITAFSNGDPGRAAQIARKFGLARHYSDYRAMFDSERPDFVDVITPPAAHAAICSEASKRGIHIICQKPLAPDFVEAEAIVANAAAAKARFMVHENFRFQPWYREIKRQLEAQAIGDQVFSLAFRCRMGDGWGEKAYTPRQPYFRDYPRLLSYETGVHFIDTYRYLAGEIVRVAAWHRRLNPVIKGEDCALLVFEFASGAIGQWDANRYNETTVPNPRYTFGEFLIEGNGGSIRLAADSCLALKRLGEQEMDIPYAREDINFCGDCCYFTQRHFVDRLLDGRPFETSGEDYLKTLALQEAVYLSAQERQPVELRPGRR